MLINVVNILDIRVVWQIYVWFSVTHLIWLCCFYFSTEIRGKLIVFSFFCYSRRSLRYLCEQKGWQFWKMCYSFIRWTIVCRSITMIHLPTRWSICAMLYRRLQKFGFEIQDTQLVDYYQFLLILRFLWIRRNCRKFWNIRIKNFVSHRLSVSSAPNNNEFDRNLN